MSGEAEWPPFCWRCGTPIEGGWPLEPICDECYETVEAENEVLRILDVPFVFWKCDKHEPQNVEWIEGDGVVPEPRCLICAPDAGRGAA